MFTRKLNNQFIAVNIFSKHIIVMRVTYGCYNWHRNFFSFITEFTLRLEMMRAFAISFMAYSFFSLRSSTFQTLPKPPRPITYRKLKWFLLISGQNKSPQVSQNLICLRHFSKNFKIWDPSLTQSNCWSESNASIFMMQIIKPRALLILIPETPWSNIWSNSSTWLTKLEFEES